MRLGLLAALLVVALATACERDSDVAVEPDAYSESAFRRWLAAGEGRAASFERFERFLVWQGVADVVPAWQLMRTDSKYAARCGLDAFQTPPEAQWPAIVPTLGLVRDEVIPAVGRVEVVASARDEALNECANGAKGSRHLAFAAVDLVAPERPDKRELFADLCAMHRRVGPQRGMGLGAYFDPERPRTNTEGRFHIDQSGFRSWGFGYSGTSSGCRKLSEV